MRNWRLGAALMIVGLAAAQVQAQAAPCQIGNDRAYTEQILHDTTEPYFLTDWVNHLPADSCVPAPDAYLHHIVGAPDVLDHLAAINGYMRLLAARSPRVKVFSIGRSEEGREMILVAIADRATIANLKHYRELTARLADPRGLTDAAAEAVVAQAKPIYWVDGSIHSPETGSPEMLMELAYRLAVEETPFIEAIRRREITLITPVVQTDGWERKVDLYMYHVHHPKANPYPLTWWGHYVSHDDNRDAYTLSLDLTKNMMAAFLRWHPQVWHDLHESESYLYASTGTGPYNPWLDPIMTDELTELAWNDVRALTAAGVPGVWTHGFFDGWAMNGMVMLAQTHNSIGRFYETQGVGGADTREVEVGAAARQRAWYRENPPLPKVLWSARDNANLEESGVLSALADVASNGRQFLRDFYLKSRRAVQKARREGPAAYVFPAAGPRPYEQARLLNILAAQGIEISRAERAFTAEGHRYAAGSYVVRMDQPYSRAADDLLDVDYYSPHSPPPYDDTGWTLWALANVRCDRIADAAILSVPMTRAATPIAVEGGVRGAGAVALVAADAGANLAAFRYALADMAMRAAEAPFTAAGRHYGRGTWILGGGDAARIAGAARRWGIAVERTATTPAVASHPLLAPRIALLHDWQSTQADGWYRVGLDELHIPYTYLADTRVRTEGDLRTQFDAIIVPPMERDLAAMIRGIPERGNAMPWENTAEMPDLVAPGLDSSPDIRGGLGLGGLEHLDEFVRAGGLLISVGRSDFLPTETGMTTMVTLRPPRKLDAAGDVLRATVEDRTSPIAYGYGPDLDVYYQTNGILRVGVPSFGGGAAEERASGRGSATEPDVIQGRVNEPPQKPPERTPREKELHISAAMRAAEGSLLPTPAEMPRVIVRFAAAKDLLVSGLLEGGEELAETPAVVEVPRGEGHIVLFATNPMWRNENRGSYALLLNAIMNYRSLDAGGEGAPGHSSDGGGRRHGAQNRVQP